ncbi:zinc finger protein 2-like [Anoplophora glabripennis]|uniref:zinc finger protein 2-like n=1 Tax=Anoplophora glabripennis TaxID=217634 RepID=UPI0008758266|nr:zinc finger protein 2-like [Anoplophora glabripennis]XP_018561547.1 zinc finger protein 2-like [Anoplophora glabripennis]
MSTSKNLRKRPKTDYNESSEVPRQKVKTEDIPLGNNGIAQTKQPIVAPNGKVFYPCQYCCKIFPQKLTSITHMKKCPNKTNKPPVLNETGINNNDIDKEQTELRIDEDLNSSNSSTENVSPESENKTSQCITKDVSIYDYNEQDDDLEDKDLRENGDEVLNNRQCKHCSTLFDNPLELLRHTRDCHNFPRTILPPDEIEKYFDYPNRQYCPICEKPIKTRNFRSVFIKHLLVHTTGLTHECSICKKKFRRRDHMRAHEKRHIVSL